MDAALHRHTPTLSVVDPRGLALTVVSYHRIQLNEEAERRTERCARDATGRHIRRWDPRLWADGGEGGEPNQHTSHSLSGLPVWSESTDAGRRSYLFGAEGQPLGTWDGRGTYRWNVHDDQLRVREVHEQSDVSDVRCIERFTYGGPLEDRTNRCGRLIRHDDTAGCVLYSAYDLTAGQQVVTQRFLAQLEMPDWPAPVAERESLLESDSYTTRAIHDAIGVLAERTDAVGNQQSVRCDVAGQTIKVTLRPTSRDPVTVAHGISYDALGRMTTEAAGNGVVTKATYSDASSRLRHLHTRRDAKVLQSLTYVDDPTCRLVRIEDAAQPTDWFDGARVDAVSLYRYDTLYRLVQASGRESVLATIRPGLPDLGGPGGNADANRMRPFTQSYTYDAAGNLLVLRHIAGPTQYTRTMVVDSRSNRAMPSAAHTSHPRLDDTFDANGNLLQLDGTRGLHWDAGNRLQRVTQIRREDLDDDDEVYVYDGIGRRRRKLRTRWLKGMSAVSETKYLPGLEIRTDSATGEALCVAVVTAGRCEVRYLCWHDGHHASSPPQWRYSLDDHLGSSVLELDGEGNVISQEGYYPYGGTAWWAARNAVEATYKTVRYARRERDATGLYCHGHRYYAPWLFRWTSPDPHGDADGSNLFEFVGSDPVNHVDPSGHAREDAIRRWERARFLALPNQRVSVRTVTPGIVAVAIRGDAAFFAELGFSGLGDSTTIRRIDYLAIDSRRFEGVVAGGHELINPIKDPDVLAGKAGASFRPMAYINGTYFNAASAAAKWLPQHASIGGARSLGGPVPSGEIPRDYLADYRVLRFSAGTYLSAAPALTRGGAIVFHAGVDERYLWLGEEKLQPGTLHHAEHPNPRSAISQPAGQAEGTVRLVVGRSTGRKATGTGFSLTEWASTMSRIDRLDPDLHESTNLDGGGKSMMGVLDASARHGHSISQEPHGTLISTAVVYRRRPSPLATPPLPGATRGRCCAIS